jgi:hypothetical protein
VSTVAPLNRMLEQELNARLRGVNLEGPVCGEFVLHCSDGIVCPECQANYGEAAQARLQLDSQAG